MSIQSDSISNSSDSTSADVPNTVPGKWLRHRLEQTGKTFRHLRVWLLFVLPFAFACWKPMQNSFRNWGNPDNPLAYQCLVPFAVALLLWQQRLHLQTLWARIQAYPVTDKRRRGNMIPLVIGCLIVLFGHLVYVDSFFGIGLLLILTGTIYYIFGGMMLRAIAGPLSLLVLMINPPDSLISNILKSAINSTSLATSSLLSLFGKSTSANNGTIRFPTYSVEITEPLNGANMLIALLFITFICALYQRRTPLYTFCFMVMASVLVIFVHLIRVSFYAITMQSSPGISRLIPNINPWIVILILAAGIVYATQSLDLLSLRMRIAAKQREKYGYKKKGVSRRIERAVIDPIFNASDKGFMYVSTKNRKISKSINAFFKKLIPTSKSKRRNRW